MNTNNTIPGHELYMKVRGSFIMQNNNLSQWCRANGVKPQHARACLIGSWNGPKGKKLRNQLIEAAGLDKPSDVAA